MLYTFIFLAGMITAISLTPILIIFLRNIGIVDRPGKRRINKKEIPRMGGIVIFFSVIMLLFIFYKDLNSIQLIIISGFIIASMGAFDDILGLIWYKKFLIQIISAVLMIMYFTGEFSVIEIFGIRLTGITAYVFLLVFIVGGINSINLIDGLDGLASGLSLLVFIMFFALGFYIEDDLILILSAAFAGSIIGFLKYNAFPAKIFLGDTGSLTLGFFLVFLSIYTSAGLFEDKIDITYPVIVLGVPILDTIKVMTGRMLKRNNPFHPDRTHLHHIILENNIKHKLSVFIVQSFNLSFQAISLFYLFGDKNMAVFSFIILAFMLFISKAVLTRINELKEFVADGINGFIKNSERIIRILAVYLVTPGMALLVGAFLALALPLNTVLSFSELLFLIILEISVLMMSMIQYKKTKEIDGLYVFLNTIGYLFVSKLSSVDMLIRINEVFSFNFYTDFYFFVLIVMIVFYLLIKDAIFNIKEGLFSGIDLILLLMIAMVFILSNITQLEQMKLINAILYQSFIIYLVFKIISRFQDSLGKYILLMSFLLPLASLIYLVF